MLPKWLWRRRSKEQKKSAPYPNPRTFPTIETVKEILSLSPGEWESFFKGEGYDLSDIREWQPGDPLSRVHIPRLIRTEKEYVVERVPERSLRVLLAADFSDSINSSDELRSMRSIALLLLGAGAIAQDNEVGFIAFSNTLEAHLESSFSLIQFERIRETIAQFEGKLTGPSGIRKTTDFTLAASLIHQTTPQQSLVFFLSDFFAPRQDIAQLLQDMSDFDFTPVLLDTRLVWEKLPQGLFLVDAGGAEEQRNGKLALVHPREIKAEEEKRIRGLEELFQSYRATYVHLQSVDPQECVAEFTKCFRKKIQQRR